MDSSHPTSCKPAKLAVSLMVQHIPGATPSVGAKGVSKRGVKRSSPWRRKKTSASCLTWPQKLSLKGLASCPGVRPSPRCPADPGPLFQGPAAPPHSRCSARYERTPQHGSQNTPLVTLCSCCLLRPLRPLRPLPLLYHC